MTLARYQTFLLHMYIYSWIIAASDWLHTFTPKAFYLTYHVFFALSTFISYVVCLMSAHNVLVIIVLFTAFYINLALLKHTPS